MNNLNPQWQEIRVSLSALCNGDVYRPILFEVADYDSDGGHDHIGSCKASLNDLLSSVGSGTGAHKSMPLVGPASKGGKIGGHLICTFASLKHRPSFLDYIMGGTQINFCCAIDFTGSNGHQSSPSSLHYVSNAPNQYQQCISRVGDVLEFYDHDKEFPTWGFGGVTRPNGTAVAISYPEGLARPPVWQASWLRTHQQCRPSSCQGRRYSRKSAKQRQLSTVGMDGSQYYVLLIITDGVITDMAKTKDAIVAACDLPLSILIVGVGNADENGRAGRGRRKASFAESARISRHRPVCIVS